MISPTAILSNTAKSSALAAHARKGLGSSPKRLDSSWFYDEEGSKLFQKIMALPEYYLTRVEESILREQATAIAASIVPNHSAHNPNDVGVDVIELGSGDGAKTVALVEQIVQRQSKSVYHPMDISEHAIGALTQRFKLALPEAKIQPSVGDYFTHWPKPSLGHRQVVMFLGSNLGNFDRHESVQFLKRIRSFLRPGDGLLLGLDLQKDPRVILAAYDDSQGVTAEFNLNLLTRLNREVGTNFVLEQFHHYASYCPLDGAARSFIVSRQAQRVSSATHGIEVNFSAGESIYVEQSQKYSLPMIDGMATQAQFTRQQVFQDPKKWYAIVYLAAE